jgi:30S ribosomal protein S31
LLITQRKLAKPSISERYSEKRSKMRRLRARKEDFRMGKGDKRTKRGKIFNGSYGAHRPKKRKKKKKDS